VIILLIDQSLFGIIHHSRRLGHRSSVNSAMRSILSVQGKIMTRFLTANLMIEYAALQIF